MVTDADRGRKAASVSLPAPTLGVNSRDAWAAMDPRYAVAMVNMFTTPSAVTLRKGFSQQSNITWVSGVTRQMVFMGGFIKYGDSELWAYGSRFPTFTVQLLENVFTGTEVTGFTAGAKNGHVQFANAAGQFVVVAGASYFTYDGTTWTDNTASLVASTTWVSCYAKRLWFLKTSGSPLSAWYLPTNAITGALIEFPLGGVASKGGSLKYIATWTQDGGEGGSDDRIVFLTTNGQVIVYTGTDPSSISSFALVGVFDVSKPIGSPLKFGTDLLLLCEDGLYSLTEILSGRVTEEYSVTSNIRPSWQASAAGAAFSISGVTAAYSAKLNMIAVNFPTSALVTTGRQTSDWWVMNTLNKAWTKFTGLDAYAIAEFQGDIYFCNIDTNGNSYVYKFGTATDDNGAAITGYCQQAYSTLGAPGTQKLVTALKPAFTVTGTHTVGFAIDVDYQQAITTSTSPTNDRSYAAGSYSQVLHYPTIGEALSVFCEVSSSASGFSWYSTGLLTMAGGFV